MADKAFNLAHGQIVSRTFYVDQDDIRHLARISGTSVREHIDQVAAKAQGFRRLVAPNALTVSYVESVIATDLQVGSLANRTFSSRLFHQNAVCAGDRITVQAEVSMLIEDGAVIRITARNQDNEVVLQGTVSFNMIG